MMLQKVKDIYSESIQIQIAASSMLSENIANATQMVMQCLLGGNKVIACGVSRSYANAQFLVSKTESSLCALKFRKCGGFFSCF